MKKAIPLLLAMCAMLVFSCVAPKYKSKEISKEELSIAEKQIVELPDFKRSISDKDAKILIKKVYAKLLPTAKAINDQIGENAALWELKYSPKTAMNAYAANEGEIVIYKGILERCKYDDEIAFVIAHEMAHHIANHINESRQNAFTGAMIGGLVTGSVAAAAYNNPYTPNYNQSQINELTIQGMEAGKAIGGISYSKAQENEADYIGAFIVGKSGYNLKRARNIFGRLAKAGRSQHNERHSVNTHPAHGVRLAKFDSISSELINGTAELLPKNKSNKPKEKKAKSIKFEVERTDTALKVSGKKYQMFPNSGVLLLEAERFIKLEANRLGVKLDAIQFDSDYDSFWGTHKFSATARIIK